MDIKYKKPPVDRVIFTINFERDFENKWNSVLVGGIFNELKNDYLEYSDRKSIFRKLDKESGDVINVETIETIFSDKENKIEVSVSEHYLSFVVKRDYIGWDKIKPKILSALGAYIKITKPSKISNFILRYINKIYLPLTGENEFNEKEYFEVYPMYSNIGEDCSKFELRMRMNYDGGDLDFIMFASHHKDRQMLVILDLIYLVSNIDVVSISDISEKLELAHLNIGNVFEGTITEKLRNEEFIKC